MCSYDVISSVTVNGYTHVTSQINKVFETKTLQKAEMSKSYCFSKIQRLCYFFGVNGLFSFLVLCFPEERTTTGSASRGTWPEGWTRTSPTAWTTSSDSGRVRPRCRHARGGLTSKTRSSLAGSEEGGRLQFESQRTLQF